MIGRMLLRNLLGLDPDEALKIGISHRAIYRVDFESNAVVEITA
jgi:broad specificity phosphatase PhoE